MSRFHSLLDLARERYTPVLPVDGDKLGELVGTLDDTRKRLRNRRTVSLLARHLTDKQERCMTQLHLLTSLDGKRGHLLGRDLRHQFGDAARDLDSVLVELALPEQAREHRTPQ